jgi:hypothetical protein
MFWLLLTPVFLAVLCVVVAVALLWIAARLLIAGVVWLLRAAAAILLGIRHA